MLVLERKNQERVRIEAPNGDRLFVQLVRQKANKSVIGFEFPDGYRIVRDELPPLEVSPQTDPAAKAA